MSRFTNIARRIAAQPQAASFLLSARPLSTKKDNSQKTSRIERNADYLHDQDPVSSPAMLKHSLNSQTPIEANAAKLAATPSTECKTGPPQQKPKDTDFEIEIPEGFHYANEQEGISSLISRGFIHNFSLRNNLLVCDKYIKSFDLGSVNILEIHGFEGAANPSENTILFAIEARYGAANSDERYRGVLKSTYKALGSPAIQNLIQNSNDKRDMWEKGEAERAQKGN
eukprot:TRINITY_DN12561_c0_g1_i1.p1 TRINITY_DN12561_c0_g1~~TRINITY_DN12561_c0_g1_i1.p1  ORF type:complete len:238 (+),score=75.75 TRINITY_DN12561_c0_g1_i1:36-716(+)